MAMKQVSILPRRSLLTLYHSLVESRLTYCNTVWGNCDNRQKTIIQQLQNKAARIVTQIKTSYPTETNQLIEASATDRF